MYRLLECILVFFFVVSPAFSQTIEVNPQNRTIEVVASETVRVDPDVADVTLGCLTYGQTHDEAYQANLAAVDKVIKVLLASGVTKDQIQSSAIQLSETSPDEIGGKLSAVQKARQFKALQSWQIHVAAAQKLIDVAVQAGANGIENVSWDVADQEALEAKARAAAMEKARATASEIAMSAGDKLGQLLYASNVVNGIMATLLEGRSLQTSSATLGPSGGGFPTPRFSLQLFPEKVEKQATVRTVFALE